MIRVRKSKDRGHAEHGWLESYHTFSFAEYRDPRFRGFRDLLVINEDWVQPGQGFGRHGHRDMEIITYLIEGELEHKDSMGTGSVLRPGDIQRMSAGRGVQHSEFNHSNEKVLHLLQIWITPQQDGLDPSYEEKRFAQTTRQNQLRLVVAPRGEDGAVTIHQDAKLYACLLDAGKTVEHSLSKDRYGWIQIVKGHVNLNDEMLGAGDGASISDTETLVISASSTESPSEFLLFDLS